MTSPLPKKLFDREPPHSPEAEMSLLGSMILEPGVIPEVHEIVKGDDAFYSDAHATIYRGIIFLLTNGKWINAHQMTEGFKAFPRAQFLGLPVMAWIAVAVIAGFALFIRRSALGRALFAVGGNPHAAVYAGIDVGRTQFMAFVISGALAGLTGYLWVARYAVAYVDIAGGFELDVVAACVIGGIAIAGGAGSVAGAVMGALFLGIIKNALPVVGISPFWQMAISGTAILVAVAVNSRGQGRQGRLILKQAEHRA